MADRGLSEAMRACAILTALLTAILLPVLPADAATSSAWQRSPESAVRLVSAVEATGKLQALPLGLEFDLAPGWKTYWRSPGEGGVPPELDWGGSENVDSARLAWPAPKRFSILGIDSIGYSDNVVLPIELRVQEPGRPTHIRLTIDYLTCEKICIPQHAEIALDIPSGTADPSSFAHLIDRYRGRVPGPAGPMLSIESARWAGSGDDASLKVIASGEDTFQDPDLFIEGAPAARLGTPTYTIDAGGRRATFTIARMGVDGTSESEAAGPLTFTLVDGERAIEQRVAVTSAPPAEPLTATSEGAGILAVLAIALLGGLVLNLMPCVLPVISIKVLGLLEHGGGDVAAARKSFLATSAGIIASFLLLAGAAIAVRAAGVAVGWGVQFQQPAFLVSMIFVLVLFACNLWGVYEVSVPRWLNDRAGRIGVGGGRSGSFFTGMLATLLATPCSAPFVGTGVAYALSRGPSEIFLIFAALGFGLALPYLMIAAYPRAATILPRPGAWMIWLRRFLGFVLVGTGVWLLSVVHAQVGSVVTTMVAAIAAALVLVLWFRRPTASALRAGVAAGLVIAGVVVPVFIGSNPPESETVANARWQPFDPEVIASHVSDGRVVFVDVTADWCITCQVNKAVVLDRPPIAERLFGSDEIVPMRADWTLPSDEIMTYLASFGRYGIPFNVVYGPGAPEGLVLPELLTTEAVMTALNQASATRPRTVSAR